MRRHGFSLVELVVALTIFSIGILALAGAAAMAQRSFGSADAMERAARLAAAVMDSLLRQPLPEAGQRVEPGGVARWRVLADSAAFEVLAEVQVADGGRTMHFDFRALQLRPPP